MDYVLGTLETQQFMIFFSFIAAFADKTSLVIDDTRKILEDLFGPAKQG